MFRFLIFLVFFAIADAANDPKCKYHYTKRIMKFLHQHKSPDNTINMIETIAKLSKATGETRLYLADCLGILNDENRDKFRGTHGSPMTPP
jgi:hypothetical protein